MYTAVRVPVDLLPSRSLHFSGACELNLTASSLHLVDVSDPERQPERRRAFWPIASVSHCGHHRHLLLIHTKQLVYPYCMYILHLALMMIIMVLHGQNGVDALRLGS